MRSANNENIKIWRYSRNTNPIRGPFVRHVTKLALCRLWLFHIAKLGFLHMSNYGLELYLIFL